MDEHINSMSDAYQKYIDAANTVLAEYHSAGGLHNEATNLALEKFRELREHFQMTCDNAEGFVHTMTQHVKELEVAHHTNAVDPNAAPEPVPVMPSYAQILECLNVLLDEKGQLESDARYGDGADVAEEPDTAASTQAVANPEDDPNKPPTEAAVEHDDTAALASLPDIDLNKTA